MKRKLALFFFVVYFFIFPVISYGQIKDIGLPFINNYSREDYNARTQNWSITQDDEGVMYFANNGGLLAFNGGNWELYPLPNNVIVRSVAFLQDKIFAGGFNEFGYFIKSETGGFVYNSLSSMLDSTFQSFDEIWRIYEIEDAIIFQSYLGVFIYKNDELHILEPKSRFGFSYKMNDKFYVIDRKFGLYLLNKNKLEQVIEENTFFEKNEIVFLLPYKNNSFLVGTTNSGIYIYDGNNLLAWNSKINKKLIEDQVYTGIVIDEKFIAIGTVQNGVYILDKRGKLYQHLNRSKGLQNNTVLSLYYDKYQNLWLGLDNGIDMLELNSPFSILNYCYNIEATYTSLVFANKLYIGTNQGLFYRSLKKISNNYLYQSKFQMVEGTMGQVWKLKIIDNQLFCGHNYGVFIIDDDEAMQVSKIPGGWDFQSVPWNNDYIISGSYSGLVSYKKNAKGTWEEEGKIEGFSESSKEIMFDDQHYLWVTHSLKGVYRLKLAQNLNKIIEKKLFPSGEGLVHLPHNLVEIDDELYILSNDSLIHYNNETDQFQVDEEKSGLFVCNADLTRLIEDQYRDIWFFSENTIGVSRLLEDGTYFKITKPFNRIKNSFISASYENVYRLDENNSLIGSQDGLLFYTPNASKNFDLQYHTYISGVKVHRRSQDTSIYKTDLSAKYQELPVNDDNIEIAYKYNSIIFDFYTPYYEAPRFVQHAYRLLGFSDQWSNWEVLTSKEFTNLREGTYTFEVKAKNIYDQESEIKRYTFEILPPIYRSLFAYIVYFSILLILIVLVIIYFRHKINKTRKIEEEKLKTKEIQFEKEVKKSEAKIEELQKEKLRNEMRLKNMELANSTMNLIQKNKLLNKLKKQLFDVSEKARSNMVKVSIKEIIARIDKDLTNEKNLKVFDKYFDQVHQDFIKRMREKHPGLTPKDLRLCAYLRMNLSTKEIAPLMNVSIRGLEISRYRLRKKLELDHETNLVDYIMEI